MIKYGMIAIEEPTPSRMGLEQVCLAQAINLINMATVIQDQKRELMLNDSNLAAKEACIQDQARQILHQEQLLAKYQMIWRCSPGIQFLYRIHLITTPRFGRLNHYPPRKLTDMPLYNSRTPNHKLPKVSIVTPSFYQKDYIERTIQSVLKQNYPILEYRIQDGGSCDGTVQIVTQYVNQLTGLESIADTGQAQAINRGFARTSGEIMAWLNSDDILLPGAIAYVVDYFQNHPEVDVVYGNRLIIDNDDLEIGQWVLPAYSHKVLAWIDFVPQETLFWRRRIWEKIGGCIDESFAFAMDWDLLIRFRAAGAVFAHIPRFLGGFRVHDAQKTTMTINTVGFKEMNRIRNRVLGHVPTQRAIKKAIKFFILKHLIVDMLHRIKQRLTQKASA